MKILCYHSRASKSVGHPVKKGSAYQRQAHRQRCSNNFSVDESRLRFPLRGRSYRLAVHRIKFHASRTPRGEQREEEYPRYPRRDRRTPLGDFRALSFLFFFLPGVPLSAESTRNKRVVGGVYTCVCALVRLLARPFISRFVERRPASRIRLYLPGVCVFPGRCVFRRGPKRVYYAIWPASYASTVIVDESNARGWAGRRTVVCPREHKADFLVIYVESPNTTGSHRGSLRENAFTSHPPFIRAVSTACPGLIHATTGLRKTCLTLAVIGTRSTFPRSRVFRDPV